MLVDILAPENAPSLMLVGFWCGALRCLRNTGYGIALFGLCGTTIHEACHWVVGWVLNAQPVSISLFPKKVGDQWVLGSVGFVNLNIWNSAFVTMAPLAMLPLGLLMFNCWVAPAFAAANYLSWLLTSYVTACCVYASCPSVTDIRVGAPSVFMYGSIGYGLWHFAS